MNRLVVLFATLFCCVAGEGLLAQQPPQAQPQPPAEAQRIDARKEVIVNWILGDQAWSFRDIQTTYEPVKGYLEPRGDQGYLAVWNLRLIRELEEGAAKLHDEILGSPFRVVLLDADRKILDSDAPAQITPVSGAKTEDTIELSVGLDAKVLKAARMIRVQRRTDVGF